MTYKQLILLTIIWAPLALAFGIWRMRIFARVLAQEKEIAEEKREQRERENNARSHN